MRSGCNEDVRGKKLTTNRKKMLRLTRNTIIIMLAYFFSGVNLTLSRWTFLKDTDVVNFPDFSLIGIIMLFMVVITYFDERKENRGMLAMVAALIMHYAFCIVLTYLFSLWWLLVYVCELVIGFCIIIILSKVGVIK